MRDSIISHEKFWTEDSCQHYRHNIVPSKTCFIQGQEFCSFGHVHQDESENFYHVLDIDAYTDVMGLSAQIYSPQIHDCHNGSKVKVRLTGSWGMSAKDTKTMSSRTQAKSQKSGEAIDFGQQFDGRFINRGPQLEERSQTSVSWPERRRLTDEVEKP